MSYKSNNILELFSSEIHSLDTPGRSRPLDATLCNYPLGKSARLVKTKQLAGCVATPSLRGVAEFIPQECCRLFTCCFGNSDSLLSM